MKRRRAAAWLAATVTFAAPLSATGVAPAERRSGDGWSLVEVRLPGAPVAAVAVPRAGGGRDLFVLVAPAGGRDGERSLWRVEAPAEGGRAGATRLRDGLSAGLDALDALDLDGDGRLELLAGEPRRLYCLGTAGGPDDELAGCTVEAPAWIDLRSPDRSRLRAPATARRWLVTAEAGRARFYSASGAGLSAAGSARLPLEVDRQRGGLRLFSPPVAAIDPAGETPAWFAGPLAAGPTRLRLARIAPREAGGVERSELWCRLPRPESVASAVVEALDGAPHLVVATTRADRLSLLEKLAVRVFPLAADRTRTGRAATFAAPTDFSRWRSVQLALRDTDGDGRDDLLAIGAPGLRGDGLAVMRWAGLGGGRFADVAATTRIDGGDAGERRAELARDLTGDGVGDLLLLDPTGLGLHAGVAAAGRAPFESKPRATVALGVGVGGERRVEVAVGGGGVAARRLSGAGAGELDLMLADLDGRGRDAAIVVGEEGGAGLVRVVRFAARDGARR